MYTVYNSMTDLKNVQHYKNVLQMCQNNKNKLFVITNYHKQKCLTRTSSFILNSYVLMLMFLRVKCLFL